MGPRGDLDNEGFDVTMIGDDTIVVKSCLSRFSARIESMSGLEARGITRVLPEERDLARHGWSICTEIFTLWFSTNLTAIPIIPGLLGPVVYSLGCVDCICITIFASALSSGAIGYIATFGAVSGHRTMILGRFFLGYWPSKMVALLNIIMQLGWATIGAIIAGQMISIVGRGLTIAVGCVISSLAIGIIAIFGLSVVHKYQRYAWAPQVFALLVLVGSSGRGWDVSLASAGSAGIITANRCSFFALQFSSSIGLAAFAADFNVYYPTTTSRALVFASTWWGNWTALIATTIIGVGIGTGIVSGPPGWADAYENSSAALLLACYDGLGGLGELCLTIFAFGSIASNAPSTYTAANMCQVLGRHAQAVPRWAWCLLLMVIELVCSVAGRNSLCDIFENFLPIMSYWICSWLTIIIEEHLIFHIMKNVPFDWNTWEEPRQLPLGIAALLAWLVGWAGAIIGMDQVWYQGPMALRVGGHGGDIGVWLAIGFAGTVYPALRFGELKMFGR